jgi:hypothetical protein
MLAIVRPDSWNLPLFMHVAGAMALVGSLIVASYSLRIARTRGDQPAVDFAFRTLRSAVLPSYLVMRVGAQWIQSKENVADDATWLGIGFITSDMGLLVLLIGLLLTGLAARRTKAGASVAGSTGLRVATILTGILIAAYVVAVWAMTTKPV